MTDAEGRDVTVADQQLLAQRFEEQRTRLRAVAYRMLGSLTEADDAVQEAWLRLSRADTDDVTNLAAWLTTVTGRICLDMLRSRTARREEPLDLRLPDPVKPGGSSEHALVNGAAGVVTRRDGRMVAVLGFTITHDKIVAIDVLADPERLSRLDSVAG
jgi:RNA polymerase sigma factor (sigma-70 family)